MGLANTSKLGGTPSEGNEFDDEDPKDANHAQSESIWLAV